MCNLQLVNMESYAKEKRIKIVKTHYKNGENFAQTILRVK